MPGASVLCTWGGERRGNGQEKKHSTMRLQKKATLKWPHNLSDRVALVRSTPKCAQEQSDVFCFCQKQPRHFRLLGWLSNDRLPECSIQPLPSGAPDGKRSTLPQKSPPLAARPPLRSPTVLPRRSPSVVSYELALAGAGGRPSPTAEAGGGALSNLTERRLGSGGRVETRRCGLSSGAVPVHRYWPECLLDDAHTPKHMSVQGAGRGFAAGL